MILSGYCALSRGLFLMCAAAHTRIHFFCLSKRNEPKKKTPDDLPLAVARAHLGGRKPSAMVRQSRFSRFCPVMLGGVNGTRGALIQLRNTPSPWCSRVSQPFPEASACMSEWARPTSSRARNGEKRKGSRNARFAECPMERWRRIDLAMPMHRVWPNAVILIARCEKNLSNVRINFLPSPGGRRSSVRSSWTTAPR